MVFIGSFSIFPQALDSCMLQISNRTPSYNFNYLITISCRYLVGGLLHKEKKAEGNDYESF